MRITACGNSGDASAAAISAPRAVIASAVCAYNVRPDPACVHVDCAGPVREDVPSHGLLGEGLTGENNRLKRGLQRCTPAIPLLSGIRGGGGDVKGGRISPAPRTRRVLKIGAVTLAHLRPLGLDSLNKGEPFTGQPQQRREGVPLRRGRHAVALLPVD